MSQWYIVKLNWDGIPDEYLGLCGDDWTNLDYADNYIPGVNIHINEQEKADCGLLLKKINSSREYLDIHKSGFWIFAVTDYDLAKVYFSFLSGLNLNPIFIIVTDDLTADDCDGYDFGNPTGGYSVITAVALGLDSRDNEIPRKYLNEHLLFPSMNHLNEFVNLVKDRDDVEYLDGGTYHAVAIKKVKYAVESER
jgi:hypothetical protein